VACHARHELTPIGAPAPHRPDRARGARTGVLVRHDRLQADACGPAYSYDSNSRLKLESKDHMRARGARSPDEWDAVALTFAEPVAPARVPGLGRRIVYPPTG
jgi:hypothetical protein